MLARVKRYMTTQSSTELSAQVGLEVAPGANILYVSTVPIASRLVSNQKKKERRYALQYTLLLLELEVVLTVNVGETPLAGDDDFLATGEFVTGTTESLPDNSLVRILGTDGEDDLADVNTGNGTVGLAPGATHTSLESGLRKCVRRLLWK